MKKDEINKLLNKKLWLFDMDGTIYLGNKLFDGTLDLLNNIKNNNSRFVFITNNSSKNVNDYIKKLSKMGIKTNTDDFYTSTDASISILKEKFSNCLIYAQGTKSFIKSLRREKLKITTKYNKNSKCAIVGFDTELSSKKLENTCKTLLLNTPFYATNPDLVCPTEFGYIPDCGSMCFGIEKATNKSPIYIGKPNSYMITEVIKKYEINKKDVVVVGDRIYTDIASAVNAKVDSILVLSGESTSTTLENSDIKPTFVFENVKEINKFLYNKKTP